MAKKAQKKEEPKNQAAISLKSLTKSSVWDIQENDIFRMLTNESAFKRVISVEKITE